MEHEQERKKAAADVKKAKLENLEKKIAAASIDLEAHAGKKHRFDDTEYLEESRELVDNVRSAVTAGELPIAQFTSAVFMLSIVIGLLKKKKKAKMSHPSGSPEASCNSAGTTLATSTKVHESKPPGAAVSSISVTASA